MKGNQQEHNGIIKNEKDFHEFLTHCKKCDICFARFIEIIFHMDTSKVGFCVRCGSRSILKMSDKWFCSLECASLWVINS